MRTRIGAGIVIGALGAATVAAAQPAGMAPRPALVTAHNLTVKSTVGSFCTQSRPHDGRQTGLCADAVFTGTRGRLPVTPGDVVRLRFRHNPSIQDRIRSVRVFLARHRRGDLGLDYLGRAGNPVQSPRRPSRWRLTLPHDLGTANVLELDVRYFHGDAQFWAGLARH